MAAGIQGIKKKRSRKDEEEPQKVKKKRKVAAGVVSQNQHQVKIQRKEKKPHLSAEVFGEDCEIGYDQLFEFLKYAALGKRQNAAQPSWCRLHHQRRVAGVVVVVLREVSRLHYYWFYMQFKHLRKTFRHDVCPSAGLLLLLHLPSREEGKQDWRSRSGSRGACRAFGSRGSGLMGHRKPPYTESDPWSVPLSLVCTGWQQRLLRVMPSRPVCSSGDAC